MADTQTESPIAGASLTARVEQFEADALAALGAVDSEESLEQWRVRHLARRGGLAALFSEIASAPAEERRAAGAAANEAKAALQSAYDHAQERFRAERRTGEQIDVTLPGVPPLAGGLHLTRQTLYELIDIFRGMGFTVFETRIVETDDYNFTLLNTPPEHPARSLRDTFYITDEILLRTETSPGQIHVMRQYCPEPIRAILPGKVYRYDATDATHEIMFHQIEGLAIGPTITLANLKGVLQAMAQQFFGEERSIRFRGHYFPFTEPSIEYDVTCNCLGKGCALCKGTGWLEIGGGGMVHPVVLRNGGYDPDEVTGFAFGFGVERIALPRHGIDDIRLFSANDLRFLRQFT